MSEKRRGLGRGLGALITSAPDAPVESAASGAVVATVEDAPARPKRAGRPVDLFFPEKSAKDGQSTGNGADTATPVTKRPAGKRIPMPNIMGRQLTLGVDEPEFESETEPEVQSRTAPNAAPEAETKTESATVAASAAEPGAAVPAQTPAPDVSRETLVPVPGASFAELPVESIHPNRKQPRSVFDEEDMAELVHSVREIGILQPVVVRRSSEDGEAQYELVMGERRWRATQLAGLDTIPAIIRDTADDDLLRDALLENLHRSQLNPLEEAAAYRQLLDDFGCTHDELSERIGRSRPQISNTLRLLKLPPLVQRRLAAGIVSAGHARALLGLEDPAEMEKLAQRIVAEGLSVRATEEMVALSDGLRRPARESKPRSGARHERLDYFANSLSDRLDTSVKITLGARKGKVSIEFASVEDLNRIMTVINPEGRAQ